MKIPRIAVIGGGTFGEMHLRALSQFHRQGRCELVGLAEIDAELRAKRTEQYRVDGYADYREMIERLKPDAVNVVTPDHLHADVAVFAAEHGAHVLTEKPMDVTVEGCRRMIDASAKAGRLLQVDFHKRFDLYHLELERIVRAGRLGTIQYGYAHMEDRIEVPTEWLRRWAHRSSPAWFLGVHYYDLCRWLVRSEPTAVVATGQKQKLVALGVDTYDSVQATIHFASGASFTVQTSWILPAGHEAVVNQAIRVFGSDGMFEVDTQDRGARGVVTPPGDGRALSHESGMLTLNLGFFKESRNAVGEPVYAGYGIDAINAYVDNVTHLIRGGSLDQLAGSYASGKDGLEVTKIAVGVHESVKRGGAMVDLAGL